MGRPSGVYRNRPQAAAANCTADRPRRRIPAKTAPLCENKPHDGVVITNSRSRPQLC